jgi:hypothetical protein
VNGECEVCNKTNRPANCSIYLSGPCYDAEAVWKQTCTDSDQYLDQNPGLDGEEIVFDSGRFCCRRVSLYHALHHFKCWMLLSLKSRFERGGQKIAAIERLRSIYSIAYRELIDRAERFMTSGASVETNTGWKHNYSKGSPEFQHLLPTERDVRFMPFFFQRGKSKEVAVNSKFDPCVHAADDIAITFPRSKKVAVNSEVVEQDEKPDIEHVDNIDSMTHAEVKIEKTVAVKKEEDPEDVPSSSSSPDDPTESGSATSSTAKSAKSLTVKKDKDPEYVPSSSSSQDDRQESDSRSSAKARKANEVLVKKEVDPEYVPVSSSSLARIGQGRRPTRRSVESSTSTQIQDIVNALESVNPAVAEQAIKQWRSRRK